MHEFLKEMNREVLSKYDCLSESPSCTSHLASAFLIADHVLSSSLAVGEMPFSHDTSVMIPYTLPEEKELQMVFQFEIAGPSPIAPSLLTSLSRAIADGLSLRRSTDMDGSPESPMKVRGFFTFHCSSLRLYQNVTRPLLFVT